MTTLKEFEDALREHGLTTALTVLDALRARDKAKRSMAPARRVTGRKMTPELARQILEMHGGTRMTQQEIAFKLGVNQGRVNEVIKRGKWLTNDPAAPEAKSRDRALQRIRQTPQPAPKAVPRSGPKRAPKPQAERPRADGGQLTLGDF